MSLSTNSADHFKLMAYNIFFLIQNSRVGNSMQIFQLLPSLGQAGPSFKDEL